MKVRELTETAMLSTVFETILKEQCQKHGVRFAAYDPDGHDAEIYIEHYPSHYGFMYGVGVYTEVGSMDIADMVDKDAPGSAEILARLAKKKDRRPRYQIIGECMDDILTVMKHHGLASLRVPTYSLDRRTGEPNEGERTISGDKMNAFRFSAMFKEEVDRGEEEISHIFSFDFEKNRKVDYYD